MRLKGRFSALIQRVQQKCCINILGIAAIFVHSPPKVIALLSDTQLHDQVWPTSLTFLEKNRQINYWSWSQVLKKKKGERKKVSCSSWSETSVKHSGRSIVVPAYMAASGTGSLVFMDDKTADGSSSMEFEVCRKLRSAYWG